MGSSFILKLTSLIIRILFIGRSIVQISALRNIKSTPPSRTLNGQIVECTDGSASSYPCEHINLLSKLPTSSLSGGAIVNVWGWEHPISNVEYAIVGTEGGTSFVELSVSSSPKIVGYLPTHSESSELRDIKVYRDHAFIVSEASDHGMQIFDLTQLADLTSLTTLEETVYYEDQGLKKANSIFIQEDTGVAYITGAVDDHFCSSGGLHMIDVNDPIHPFFMGCYSNDGYTHSVQCVSYTGPDNDYTGKEICVALNEDAAVVLDVTDKLSVNKISTIPYENTDYMHKSWITDDLSYLLLGDETETSDKPDTKIVIVDIFDLDSPNLLGKHAHKNNVIGHSVYVKEDFLFLGIDQVGLSLLDMSELKNGVLAEKAYFDVFSDSEPNESKGICRTYPFPNSDTVLVTGADQGLFVVQVNFESIDRGDDDMVECKGIDKMASFFKRNFISE